MAIINDFAPWRWHRHYASIRSHDASEEKLTGSSQRHDSDMHEQFLLHSNDHSNDRKIASLRTQIVVLYVQNLILVAIVVFLYVKWRTAAKTDPSLGVWSPANDAVEYLEHHFDAALFTKTEYMGFPTDKIDQMWTDLYNFGNTIISEEDAKKLHTPTLPIPGTKDYLVELDVWYELHCLNDIRKVFYPERFPGLNNITINGKIDRKSVEFRHWEHCIDSLRQTLMCHADVAPIPFRIDVPVSGGIVARLATTHTCRNFTKIQEWAKAHPADKFHYKLEPEEAQAIIDATEWDQAPEEDVERFWPSFPGNLFFKHWREEAGIVNNNDK